MNAYCCRIVIFLMSVSFCLVLGGCTKTVSPDDEILAELVHKDVKRRRTAVFCIREMRPVPENYIPALIKALDDQDAQVSQAAAEALGEVGVAGRPFLNDLVKISNEHKDAHIQFALQASVKKISLSQ